MSRLDISGNNADGLYNRGESLKIECDTDGAPTRFYWFRASEVVG